MSRISAKVIFCGRSAARMPNDPADLTNREATTPWSPNWTNAHDRQRAIVSSPPYLPAERSQLAHLRPVRDAGSVRLLLCTAANEREHDDYEVRVA